MNTARLMRMVPVAIVVLSLAVITAAVITASAQENESAPPPDHRGGHGRMMSPEDRTNHLTKALGLNDDQKSKVLSIFQDEQKQMEALRSDNSSSREDRWSKMKQIHESTVSQIKGTLNPDQAKKFDEMQQKMEERREQRNQGNAPPPQQ
jgi:periplasmic protein CpxP/Spy